MKGIFDPKLKLYYDELMIIFPLIKTIQNQFDIQFIKVESHSDIPSNDTVDTNAKEAADQAVEMEKYGDPNWNENAIPAVVDMQHCVAALKENNFIELGNEFCDRLENFLDDEKRMDDFFQCKDIYC